MDRKEYDLKQLKKIQELIRGQGLTRLRYSDLVLYYDNYIDIMVRNSLPLNEEKIGYLESFQKELESRPPSERIKEDLEKATVSSRVEKEGDVSSEDDSDDEGANPERESLFDRQYREEEEELLGAFNPYAEKNSRDARLCDESSELEVKLNRLEKLSDKHEGEDDMKYLFAQIKYFNARKKLAEIQFKLHPKWAGYNEEIAYCNKWLRIRKSERRIRRKAREQQAYLKAK